MTPLDRLKNPPVAVALPQNSPSERRLSQTGLSRASLPRRSPEHVRREKDAEEENKLAVGTPTLPELGCLLSVGDLATPFEGIDCLYFVPCDADYRSQFTHSLSPSGSSGNHKSLGCKGKTSSTRLPLTHHNCGPCRSHADSASRRSHAIAGIGAKEVNCGLECTVRDNLLWRFEPSTTFTQVLHRVLPRSLHVG